MIEIVVSNQAIASFRQFITANTKRATLLMVSLKKQETVFIKIYIYE